MNATPNKKVMSMLLATAALAFTNMACEKGDRSYSLLSDAAAFQQTATYTPRKVDILWIIDNSGSMSSSQLNLTNNFQSFINRFQSLNYDFRMGVNASDAWLGRFQSNKVGLRRMRDGGDGNHSGVFVMDKNTPNINGVFVTNATQGINGTGDERAFSSFEDVLNHPANSDFGRDEAFLAIIIVSDEDDFSSTTATALNNNYNAANLIPVSYYKNYLDGKKGAGNYSVSAITIQDAACRDYLNLSSSGRLIGQRYMQLSAMTGGTVSSLCGDFGTSLQMISDQLISVSSTFTLDREPIQSSLRVTVDGKVVAADPVNGWTYNAPVLQLTFHGSSVPSAGAEVSIKFDPAAPKN